ncbi:hypothetical protein [Komarekiella delphini-convector]|uniref:hypothetical protein n=1 Tax=Komarekiella delphini-convector TaxID=3050158 RepID=UPI001CD86869|nr:hypothetical protein [Komarekiella delphini-convector]
MPLWVYLTVINHSSVMFPLWLQAGFWGLVSGSVVGYYAKIPQRAMSSDKPLLYETLRERVYAAIMAFGTGCANFAPGGQKAEFLCLFTSIKDSLTEFKGGFIQFKDSLSYPKIKYILFYPSASPASFPLPFHYSRIA